MLILGIFFLALFGIELHRWRRLCAWLSGAIKTINEEGKRPGWPTPFMLGQIPRNPLSLVVETEDLKVLHDRNDAAWHEQTTALVSGVWHFATGTSGFAMWERQLVAEMKAASVAVRSAGWCATLAPALALAFAQVYPPAFERILTVSAVALLSLSFAAIVYAALVLEQDCLLGPLFTRDKDRLSVTGALATIWPKLVGFAILLCAIFLPDVWEWFHTATKSINSL
jgi:hypothetical protein